MKNECARAPKKRSRSECHRNHTLRRRLLSSHLSINKDTLKGIEKTDNHLLKGRRFGNFIRRNNALRIGLLPPVPCRRIRFVGNTCVFGAKRALLSVSEKRYAESVVRRVEHVDLSLSPDFQMEFGSAMTFPNHDGGDCDAAPDDAGPDPRS